MLDNLKVAVRPREHWEAIDLGFYMLRKWWKSLYVSWFVVTLPIFVVFMIFIPNPWCLFAFWWLKPLFDRLCLFHYSKCTFGEEPSITQNLISFKNIFKTQIISALSLLRLFDWSRSFTLPVRQLEGLKGVDRRKRITLLKRKGYGGRSISMMVAYLHLEWVLSIVPLYLIYSTFFSNQLKHRADTQDGLSILIDHTNNFFNLFYFEGAPYLWVTGLLFYLAISIIEPLYVASGFSLYLNQRAQLESWDVEITFRKLAKRIEVEKQSQLDQEELTGHKKKSKVNVSLLTMLLLCFLSFDLMADPEIDSDPILQRELLKKEIEDIKSDKKFGYQVKEQRIKTSPEQLAQNEEEARVNNNNDKAMMTLGTVLQIIIWLVVSFSLIVLIVYCINRFKNSDSDDQDDVKVPETLFGMDIRKESLPEDIPSQAMAFWKQGELAKAMSLLYRGALTFLAHSENVKLQLSNTEGDCMEMAELHLEKGPAFTFVGIASTWQMVAYAHRSPDEEKFMKLCQHYKESF